MRRLTEVLRRGRACSALTVAISIALIGGGCPDDGAQVGDVRDTVEVAPEVETVDADVALDVEVDAGIVCERDEDCAGAFAGLDQCERAACNATTGVCVMLLRADGEACTDRNACTGGDHCQAGLCEGFEAVECDDGNGCTTDRCDLRDGCVFEPNTARCDDGSACTSNDQCADRRCVGQAIDCDDQNPCTADSCDAEAGKCAHTPVEGACQDGDPCTSGERCAEGACVGVPVAGCEPDVCGDSRCGLTETCEICAEDCPTCCEDGEVLDCTGSCIAAVKVGNSACDRALACEATAWDAGDCPVFCDEGEVTDCTGRCFSSTLVGDGACHDGEGGEADFRCLAFVDDAGDCSPCFDVEGEVVDCNGECNPRSWLSDGECDAAFDCPRWEGDDGDCCGATEVRTCSDPSNFDYCANGAWLGDGVCDYFLNCVENEFDAGDCMGGDGCGADGIADCSGICRRASLIGDGVCHSGRPFEARGADFYCELYNWDGADCPACEAGERAGCDGECREDTRGDAACDVALDCFKNDFDGGDCCPEGQRKNCRGECDPFYWIGDGFCDESLRCLELGYDGGDCARCEDLEMFDCNGECIPASLLGDGVCDDGRPARPDLFCDFFGNDGGDCAACTPGEIPSCDGACIAATRLGDGTCDSELTCDKWQRDRGDCCAKDEITGCSGDCYPINFVSDAWCDASLDCVATAYDGGDCTECGASEIFDCNGQCYPDTPVRRGDGVCDDGSLGVDLDCAYFAWDEGDCAPCAEGSIPPCGGGACVPDTREDLVCDVPLDCRKYGRDDCCGAGEVIACDSSCVNALWLGDGACDSVLNCAEASFDDGDCQ